MITKYGYDVVGVVLLLVVAGSLLSWFFIDAKHRPLRVLQGTKQELQGMRGPVQALAMNNIHPP